MVRDEMGNKVNRGGGIGWRRKERNGEKEREEIANSWRWKE